MVFINEQVTKEETISQIKRLLNEIQDDMDKLTLVKSFLQGNSQGNTLNGKSNLLKPKYHILAGRNTLIKARVMASNYLKDNEKVVVEAGTKLGVVDCKFQKEQHYWISLPNGNEGHIYGPHWNLDEVDQQLESPPDNGKSGFNEKGQLNVKYCNQRDNWTKYHGPGSVQCNVTSCTMMADYVLKGYLTELSKSKKYVEPEDAYGEIVAKYGDTTDHTAHTKALKDIGIDSYFSYSASLKDLLLALDKGIPVVLGVAYKIGGHIVCAVGYNSKGVWIHDPFGVRMGFSDNYENTSGAYDMVTYEWLQQKWLDLGSEAGWARFVTHVKGQPTGIPGGL